MTLPPRFRNAALLASMMVCCTPLFAAPGSGDVPPAAVGHDIDGNPVVLTDFAGKAVVITFWATWCKYCLKELPILENIQAKAGKEVIQVIAVNTQDYDVFRRASRVMRQSMTLMLASDASGTAQKAYGVKGIPHMVIIGRDGHIVKVYRGYSENSLDDIVSSINLALVPLK